VTPLEVALLLVAVAALAWALLWARVLWREPPPPATPAGERFQQLAAEIQDPRVRACFEQMARWSDRLERDAGERSRRIAGAVRDDAKRLAFDALEEAARNQGDTDLARRLAEERRRLGG